MNENDTILPLNWRNISIYNDLRHPDLPVFFYSIACNHCSEAPCMKNCPANAYTRDTETGAIIHHAQRCIGCKYCTWTCPYDAPKYNQNTKIIEKCNFCIERINSGKKPACALNCPTGALDYSEEKPKTNNITPAFVNKGIGPSIQLVPLRNVSGPEITDPQIKASKKADFNKLIKDPATKINALKEWPLIVFTLLLPLILSGYISKLLVSEQIIRNSFLPLFLGHPWFLIPTGLIGALLSMAHLGNKNRAWRSILNLKNSWLSREIFFFSAMFAGIVFSTFFYEVHIISILTIISGILAIFSVDQVYHISEKSTNIKIHSAWISMVFVLLLCFMLSKTALFIIIVIKYFLYVFRKHNLPNKNRVQIILFWVKSLFSFLIPLLLLIWHTNYPIIFVSILAGEVIDRIEFYNKQEIITPQKEINKHLKQKEEYARS